MPTLTQAGYIPPKAKGPNRPAPRKEKRRKKKRRRMNAMTVLLTVIFVMALGIGASAVALYMYTQPYQETFAPGTRVSGHSLEGLTADEGMAFVQLLTADAIENWRFVVEFDGTEYVLTGHDVGLTADLNATLDALWQRGKGGLLSAGLDMLALRRKPMNVVPVMAYDLAAADQMLERVREDIDCAPADATVQFLPGNSEPFQFTAEQNGMKLDIAPLREAIENALKALQSGSMRAEPEILPPDVYLEELEGATTLRSRVLLALDADEEGFANASLAARAINGAMIEAGAVFSFNAAVGQRTAERGYVVAREPAYGVDMQGIGGGVCQTATALYQAALLGDVEVVERNAAVRPVSYCEMGQEAAVSDQGLDLVLRNAGDSPLFIAARAYHTDDGKPMLETQFIGTPLDARYALETREQEIPAPTEPVYMLDAEGRYVTYSDESAPVGEALPGYTAIVERVTLDGDGGERMREKISEENYAAVPQVIYIGTQER